MKCAGRKRSIIIRVTGMMMITIMLMSICSCNIKNRIREIRADEYISAPELVRLLISAVDDEDELSDAYAQIPEQQRGDVSYSYLKEYTDILRELSEPNGEIKSFRLLGEYETEILLDDCLSSIGGAEAGSELYGKLGCAELLFDEETDNPVYLFFAYDKDDHAVLSSEWISDVIGIYSYAGHYFKLLEDGKIDEDEEGYEERRAASLEGIYTLLWPAYDPAEYSDAVVYAKVQALFDYYVGDSKNDLLEYEILSLSPAEYEVAVPDKTDLLPDGEIVTHSLTIARDTDGGYRIYDKIPQVIDASLSWVYEGDARRIRCGMSYNDVSQEMTSIKRTMGNPMYTSRISNERGNFYLMYYSGLCLWFRIVEEDTAANTWSVQLVEVKLYGDTYSVGIGLVVGSTTDDILIKYPFIDDSDYDLTYEGSDTKVSLTYDSDENGTITEIRLDVV